MQFTAASLLALAAYVAADAATVTADIKKIDASIKSFNNSLNAYNASSIFTALPLLGGESDLANAITQATTDTQNSSNFDQAGSNSVAIAVVNLEPDIFSVLDNLIARKAELQKPLIFGISASPFVSADLKDLKNKTDTFGAAIVSKISDTYKGVAPMIISQIDAKFEQAEAAFA